MVFYVSIFKTLTPTILVSALTRPLCTQPLPRCCSVIFFFFNFQGSLPKSCLLRAHLCLLLTASHDREAHSTQLKGFDEECERTAVPICTFTSRLASLPLDRPDLWVPGQGTPLSLICWVTPCPTPAPHHTPSLHPVAPQSFHFPGPHPRKAQQVSSENKSGDVGRVRLLFYLIFFCVFLSLWCNHTFSLYF